MRMRIFFIVSILLIFVCNGFLFGAELYKSDAVVSYYGDKFHGRPTASGENYNMNDFTCANKTLPFDTILKVTNLSNNKSVQVRVNDRGPFVSDRELDLSKAAAEKIDMIKSGTTHVKIEIVKLGEDTKLSSQTAQKSIDLMKKKEDASSSVREGTDPEVTTVKSDKTKQGTDPKIVKGTDPSPSKSSSVKADPSKNYEIQVGAFSEKSNANHFGNKIMDLGINDVVMRKAGDVYRVVIKNISGNDLDKIRKILNDNGYKDYVVRTVK